MRVAVIGAGLAGLAAAEELARAGADLDVFEARDRVGGRVWSSRFGDDTIEHGAEFILPGSTATTSAAQRLGLGLVRKGLRYGDRDPVGAGAVSKAAIRAGVERLQAPSSAERTVDGALASADLPGAVRDAIRARIEVSCGYPASDLDATVLREDGTAFGDFDTHSIEGGNAQLAAALAERVGSDRIHLESPVSALSWGAQGVQIASAHSVAVADCAVVAVPASVIDAITFEPLLPAAKEAVHRAVRYGQAAKLFVGLKHPVRPSATLSVPDRFWCWTQLRPDGGPASFVGAFAGTEAALGALGVASGPARWASTLAALRPELELDLDAITITIWPDDPWVRGAYSAPSASSPIDQTELVRPIGRLAFAGEHTAGAHHATMEGALRSGVRAARDLLTGFAG